MINRTLIFDKKKVPKILFLLLCLFISLFPPFSWGDERLSTERSRNEYINTKKAYDVLPIKQYDFVFNDMKKEFSFGWTWIENPRKYIGYDWETQRNKYESTGGKSVEVKETLTRHLIISELLINYLLAFLFSLIVSVVIKKRDTKNI